MNKDELEYGFHEIGLKGMTAEQLFHFIAPFIELAGFKWEINEPKPGYKIATIYKENRRTPTQNAALHKYFELVAQRLNDAGLDIPTLLSKHPLASIPWSKLSVKDLLWRQMQISELGKVSTRDLTTKEIDTVFDTMNRYLAEEGIHEPFPSIQELVLQLEMAEKEYERRKDKPNP